jgi:hypothetical protein
MQQREMIGSNRWVGWTTGLILLWIASRWVFGVDLAIERPGSSDWLRIQSTGATDKVQRLQSSTGLDAWQDVAVLHDGPWVFPLADEMPQSNSVFFRVLSRAKGAADDGKHSIQLPDDAFANEPLEIWFPDPPVRWLKFAIHLDEPWRVVFQDSSKYAFHYDFAVLRLLGMQGWTRQQFDQHTLYREDRRAVLGAIIIPPGASLPEYGIQLVGMDPFTREEVLHWLKLVHASIAMAPGVRPFYVPVYDQREVALVHSAWFQENGFEITAADRWAAGDVCYSTGWALGRLVQIAATDVWNAYADGRLKPDDILLLDEVPTELPFVAGIITLTPATPNSHVAILARSYGVPFGWPARVEVRQRIKEWVGRDVLMRLDAHGCRVVPVDLEGNLPAELREEILELKRPPELNIPAKQQRGAISMSTDDLTPADVVYVGGKAANYGLLRKSIADNSQVAIALTFDLWDAFMDQVMPGGKTLRTEIVERLEGHTYPPDVGQLQEDLAWVRQRIRSVANFTPSQRQVLLDILESSGLPMDRRLRFRSSTNVEDTEQFTGAGLYSSFSGCVMDDLLAHLPGPSHCNPDEPDRRGVFRAIRRVYSSFYNDNAVLERLRHGVDESKVGMAVLVHESFPDPDELANGVMTMDWSRGFGGSNQVNFRMVSQPGAESVTNPDSSARPEIIDGWGFGASVFFERRQGSGHLPLGGSVLEWEAEYRQFVDLFKKVAEAYADLHPGRTAFTLDFEYKKSAERGLQVKQVREIPQPIPAPARPSYLLGEPLELSVLEGEYGDVFAIHRLKSKWRVSTRPVHLEVGKLDSTLLTGLSVQMRVGGEVVALDEGPNGWPNHTFSAEAAGSGSTRDSFDLMSGGEVRRLTLETWLPGLVSYNQIPIKTTADLYFYLMADYESDQVSRDFMGWTTVRQETVPLAPVQDVGPGSLCQEREWIGKNGWRVETSFYWPEPPRGIVAGYTAPNIGFVETRLEGVLDAPVVLRAGAAQTYRPFHHNFSEEFLFEPGLDPGVSVEQKLALEAADIRQIYVYWDFNEPEIWVIGGNGEPRVVSKP